MRCYINNNLDLQLKIIVLIAVALQIDIKKKLGCVFTLTILDQKINSCIHILSIFSVEYYLNTVLTLKWHILCTYKLAISTVSFAVKCNFSRTAK